MYISYRRETIPENSVLLNWNDDHATSAALNTSSPDLQYLSIAKQMNILSILTLIGLVFDFILPKRDGFDNEIIDLNIEIKLEKNCLNNDCDVSSPTNDTIGVTYTPSFNFTLTGVGSPEFNNLRCEFNAVLASAATVIIVTNENKNKNIFESGPVWGQNKRTQHLTPPVNTPRINRNDKIGQTHIVFCEFDNIDCIFDSNIDGIALQYDISFGICIIFVIFFCCFFVFVFFCSFEWSLGCLVTCRMGELGLLSLLFVFVFLFCFSFVLVLASGHFFFCLCFCFDSKKFFENGNYK